MESSPDSSNTPEDEHNGFVVIKFPGNSLVPKNMPTVEKLTFQNADFQKQRIHPLTKEEFETYLDSDGRLVNEHKFRQAVFRGGVTPEIRKTVWKYLFGVYPFHSTKRERNILLAEHYVKYKIMKRRWKSLSNEIDPNVSVSDYSTKEGKTKSAENFDDDIKSILGMDEYNAFNQINWMEVQAKMDMIRIQLDKESLSKYLRIIDKDVPRTDRDLAFFKGDDNENLIILKDILYTYVYYNPIVGYSQGMNDHLSRFLLVLESEVEAYWCFSYFLKEFRNDFMEDGMVRKIDLLEMLLRKVDPDLYEYVKSSEMESLTFCHKWLILLFKRDFDVEDGLRIFEIISSHHIEMNSIEAQQVRERGRLADMEKEGLVFKNENDEINSELKFDLFLCLTILIENRQEIFMCVDHMDIITCSKFMIQKMNLDELLRKAEWLFYKYCELSVSDSFELV